MNAYSKDLRLRALEAVDRGLPRREVSGPFGVSRSTVKRWVRRRHEGEELEPKPSTGRKRRILATTQEKRALWEQLEESDEATLERHCELWEERRGVRVSLATRSRAIRNKLGWTLKKDAGCLRARREGARCLAKPPERARPSRFVFVDECSTNVRLVPLRARAPKGERAFGKAPRNWKENVTLISSISLGGMGASVSIEGSADGEAFSLYVEHFLCPTLERGQIVVMDNLQVHKMRRVRELIEGSGCQHVFLPSYSPDFNPIEEAFSKITVVFLDPSEIRGPYERQVGFANSAPAASFPFPQ
jgi:transposase